MWLLVPHILYGFGFMLVFVSVSFSFVHQVPFRLKGFLIGIWQYIINIADDGISYYQLEEREHGLYMRVSR